MKYKKRNWQNYSSSFDGINWGGGNGEIKLGIKFKLTQFINFLICDSNNFVCFER